MGAAGRRDPAVSHATEEVRRLGMPWRFVLPVSFAVGSALSAIGILFVPQILGADAWLYADAARAWVTGADPWMTGPPAAVFAGPPTMLVPFLPFVGMPHNAIAALWVTVNLVATVWLLRKLRLPGYWLGFLPIFAVVALGHIEMLAVILLLFGGRLGGLAVVIKPYMGFALVAQRRWGAIAVGLIVVAVTAPFLPWSQFLGEAEHVTASLAAQSHGDSVFGNPLAMGIAIVALASLGWRRALWLGAPLLWPFAQHDYKLMALPILTPVVAIFWAIPLPGAALTGVVAQAALERIDARRPLPAWVRDGIRPLTSLGDAMTGSAGASLSRSAAG
ncbi:MAG: hypothetical protein ABI620_06685 [Chloroflexota bacterium]